MERKKKSRGIYHANTQKYTKTILVKMGGKVEQKTTLDPPKTTSTQHGALKGEEAKEVLIANIQDTRVVSGFSKLFFGEVGRLDRRELLATERPPSLLMK